MEFTGKTVLITGSNRGIGKTAIEAFFKQGANVIACARKQNDEFECFLNSLKSPEDNWIKPLYFDLAKEEEIKEAFKELIKEKLKLDIVVNNAGVPHTGVLTMTPITKVKEVFEINFFAALQIMQLAAKIMMKQKFGNIINVVSVGGIETNPGYLAYGSSKAALIWATRTVSKELAPFGIRVNGIAPGLTKTSMGHEKSDEELKRVIERSSLKRMAEPGEIVNGMLFLASEKSSFMTGSILTIDGGRL